MKFSAFLLAGLFSAQITSLHAAIADGLIGHWTFDNTSGNTLTDSSARANDGTLYNFPADNSQWMAGQIGGALHFRGGSTMDYVIVPHYPKPFSTMSISIWVWTDVRPSDWTMVINDWSGSCGQFHVGLFGGVDMANFTASEPCRGTPAPTREGTPFPVGTWEHVAFVMDGTMMRQYHNGKQVAAITYDGTIYQPTVESFAIGTKPNGDGSGPGAYFWIGKMDDLGLWDRGLTPAEVDSIYQAGLAGRDLTQASVAPEAPTIVTQPKGQTRFAGENFSLSVVATGSAPLTYQWSKNGQPTSGATGQTLSFSSVTPDAAGQYTVKVSNGLGSATSDPATVVIQPVAKISTGLGGHWKLDEKSGDTAADSTAGGKQGVFINSPGDQSQWVTGQIGGALRFGGVDVQNYLRVADYPKPRNGTMTASAWVWNDAQEGLTFPVTPQFVSSWGSTSAKQQFRVGLQNNHLTGIIRTSGGAMPTAVDGNLFSKQSWQHIALVVDGANVRLYRNGIEAASAGYTRDLASSDEPLNLTMGNLVDDSSSPIAIPNAFFGKMDDVGFWDRALSSNEILAVYNAGLGGKDLSTAQVSQFPPSISTQPSSVTVFAGEPFSLSVLASGTAPLSYQWKKNGQGISGATSRTLTLSSATTNDSGSYTVDVSNAVSTVTSQAAVATVTPIQSVATGLAGHWTLDEKSGSTAADLTSNKNDGKLSSTFPTDDSQWVPGQIGGALHFGGQEAGTFVSVLDYPKPANGRMSASAWVWADEPISDFDLIMVIWGNSSVTRQFHLGVVANNLINYIETTAGEPNARENASFPIGSWQQVAFVVNGSTMSLYRNGAQVASIPFNGTLSNPNSPSPWAIGAKLNEAGDAIVGAGTAWKGKIDDVGLWVRALSANEVLAIYSTGKSGKDLSQAVVVQTIPPVFSLEPKSLTAYPGDTMVLSGRAAGTEPLSYQWKKDGQPIASATTADLKLARIISADAGSYTLTVSNAGGSVTSGAAVLTVANVQSITSGLVGHWKFDDATGKTLKDSTANANHGTLGNFPDDNSEWVPGQIGGALAFRGPSAQDYVLVPDYPKPSSTMSVSIWAWIDKQPTDWAFIMADWVGSCGQFHLALQGGVDISDFTSTGGCGASPNTREGVPFPVGGWQHVAFVADGSMMRLYRNGAQVSAVPYDGTIFQPVVKSFGIGMRPGPDGSGPGSVQWMWKGKLDDLGIWKRGLSPAEITAIYNAGLDGKDLTTASTSEKVSLSISLSGSSVTLSWPSSASGFVLEFSASLNAGTTWTAVQGVSGNSFTATAKNGNTFYRLRKP